MVSVTQMRRAWPIVLPPLVVRITHWLNALAIFA